MIKKYLADEEGINPYRLELAKSQLEKKIRPHVIIEFTSVYQ